MSLSTLVMYFNYDTFNFVRKKLLFGQFYKKYIETKPKVLSGNSFFLQKKKIAVSDITCEGYLLLNRIRDVGTVFFFKLRTVCRSQQLFLILRNLESFKTK